MLLLAGRGSSTTLPACFAHRPVLRAMRGCCCERVQHSGSLQYGPTKIRYCYHSLVKAFWSVAMQNKHGKFFRKLSRLIGEILRLGWDWLISLFVTVSSRTLFTIIMKRLGLLRIRRWHVMPGEKRIITCG